MYHLATERVEMHTCRNPAALRRLRCKELLSPLLIWLERKLFYPHTILRTDLRPKRIRHGDNQPGVHLFP